VSDKIGRLKSRLGIGTSWDAEYVEEDDNPSAAPEVVSDYDGEAVARNATAESTQRGSVSSADSGRRYAKDSPFASGAAPSAVTKHVRRPDLKRISEITGREVRETHDNVGRRTSKLSIAADGSTVIKPREFEEATAIADHLKSGKVVHVDLSMVSSAHKQRFIDFMAGLVYALDGHLARSSSNVYILTPR